MTTEQQDALDDADAGRRAYTPRGRGFREAVLGDLDELGRQGAAHERGLAELASTTLPRLSALLAKADASLAAGADGSDGAFAGMVVTRRVVLNLKSGSAVSGLVVRHDGPLLEVADAVLLQAGSDPAPVDGRMVIERVNVEFIQVLG